MRVHTYGEERAPVVIMLPGSFCNADTLMNIIMELEAEFHILAVDYNGQYAGYAQTSWVKDDGISTIGIALQEEVPSHL